MIDQLEQLSLALSQVSRGEAKRVADAVNRKVMDLVDAQVIKLYWIGEAQDGVLLTPMAFINNTRADDPRPFQIMPDHKGILPWVFLTRRPLWLENIRAKDLTKPMTNEAAAGSEVPPDYLDMAPATWLDSMMVVPLSIRGDIRGLYSVELRSSGRLKRPILDLVSRMARPLAALFWDADVYTYNEERTSNAISQFLNVIGSFSFDEVLLEGEERSGFIARPFAPEFSDVERRIVSLLESRHIRARAYQHGGRGYIIDDIQRQIRNSHFCIADLTGLNPNVMAEVGMMMVLKKQFLLLRRRGDDATVPFDLSQFPMYDYESREGQADLQVWNVADNRFQPFEVVLDRFVEQLPPETGFSSAQEWLPGAA